MPQILLVPFFPDTVYFGIIEEPLSGYMVQYNNCGLGCEGSEDIVSNRSE